MQFSYELCMNETRLPAVKENDSYKSIILES
jgi:hypothetical protein